MTEAERLNQIADANRRTDEVLEVVERIAASVEAIQKLLTQGIVIPMKAPVEPLFIRIRCPEGCKGIDLGDGKFSGCGCPRDEFASGMKIPVGWACDCPNHPKRKKVP